MPTWVSHATHVILLQKGSVEYEIRPLIYPFGHNCVGPVTFPQLTKGNISAAMSAQVNTNDFIQCLFKYHIIISGPSLDSPKHEAFGGSMTEIHIFRKVFFLDIELIFYPPIPLKWRYKYMNGIQVPYCPLRCDDEHFSNC